MLLSLVPAKCYIITAAWLQADQEWEREQQELQEKQERRSRQDEELRQQEWAGISSRVVRVS